MARLDEVFGVSAKPVLSYVERLDVDDKFRDALQTDKHIIVYGSSKQGKTSLVSKHLPYEQHLLVSLTPKTTALDIYQTILSQAGVRIKVSATEKSHTQGEISIGAKFAAILPVFLKGEAEVKGSQTAGSGKEIEYEEVPVNLELPQHVSDLLKRAAVKKWVILENFHYLSDEIQRQLAFDLRAYQELGVRFVILGVWREKNRMIQFNGDLLDRISEVPVEPWKEVDFRRVAEKGARELNMSFSETILQRAIDASFSSIGVFQELLKGICTDAGVTDTRLFSVALDDVQLLDSAIENKANDYAARHQRALEAIAAGHNSGGPKGDLPPLYLPYYLVKTILEAGFDGIANGISRATLHERIRASHHRGNDVRPSDMTNLLTGLANLQAAKAISPPIIDYDAQKRLVQVVDSTFYFFIKHANAAELLEALPSPLGTP